MDIANVLIYGLAVWRISSLLVNEEGPWGIFSRYRKWLEIEHIFPGAVASGYLQVPDRFFPQIFSCVWCMSIWMAIAVSVCRYFFSAPTFYVCLTLALSAVAILVERVARQQ